MNPCLVLVNGENKGNVYNISSGKPFIIGRDSSCEICLNDKIASKNHAKITLEDGGLTVEDLESSNGTFVNGRRVARHRLRAGEAITVGMSVLYVADADDVNTSSLSTDSVFSDKQAIDMPVPVHEPFFAAGLLALQDCTRQIQAILNKHADGVVKESLKVLFKVLPVSRLCVFNVDDTNKVSQGYTVMHKAGARVVHMSQSFAQKVLAAGDVVMIEDTLEDVSLDGTASIGFQQVRTIIGAPVTVQGKIRAILLGDNLEKASVFTKEHLQIMRFASKVIEVLHQLDAVYKLDNIGNFLPICACCKKIRDDQGYWNQLESFISERASVRFSHGYCPECAEKMLNEIVDSQNK